MTELVDRLRADLDRVVADTPAPPAGALARAAVVRGRRVRTRRRVAGTVLAAACVAAVVLPLAGRSTTRTSEPPVATAGPSTSAHPSPAPTTPPSTGHHRAWRVVERCDPRHVAGVCGRFRVVAIEVDGVEYRNRWGGETPLNPPNRAIQLRVGTRHGDYQVLGGVVSRSGTYVGFTLYVDGRRVHRYPDGRVHLLPVAAGRHEVKLVADGSVEGGRTSIVIGDFRRH